MKYECTDKTVGTLLHGYELGILTEKDQERFELHLLTCDHCFEELKKSSDLTNLLVKDPEIKMRIKEMSSKLPEDPDQSWLKRHVSFKLIGLVALVLLISVPILMNSIEWGKKQTTVQEIKLFPNRSSDSMFTVSRNNDIKIQFVFEDSDPGKTYIINLYDELGHVIYTNDHFSGFTLSDFGSITLSKDLFKAGRYKLDITDPKGDKWTNSQEYRFSLQYK